MAATEMWRCSECGKWSHAVRKPARHRRFWVEADDPPEEKIAEYLPAVGIGDSDGFYVWCGPFVRYLAVRTDGDLP